MTESELRTVLVTGAAGGVGAAVASRFVRDGWRVVGMDIADHSSLEGADGQTLSIRADLASVQECRRSVQEAVRWAGRLDAVVNSAGLWTEGRSEDTTEAEWDRVVGVNLKGLYFICSAAIPHLRATEGVIVNISSDAGIQGNAGAAVYCASKGGVSVLTKALALELAPDGIRVNAVCPGDIDTAMLAGQAKNFGADDQQGYLDQLRSAYPQGPDRARFVRPSEVAELVWFLCQPSAVPITGANISIDFGLSAGIV